jgi:hypothetical protein
MYLIIKDGTFWMQDHITVEDKQGTVDRGLDIINLKNRMYLHSFHEDDGSASTHWKSIPEK